MHILMINPNITAAMTRQVAAQIQECAPAISLETLTATLGVSVIASRASFAIAEFSTLEIWSQTPSSAEAILVACFGDPAVPALRELVNIPVYGLAEASMRATAAQYTRFAVVTAGPFWQDKLNELAYSLQLNDNYTGTYAIDATGLDAKANPQTFQNLLQGAIDSACRDGAKAIILGGAALAGMRHLYQSTVPLLDCVETAIQTILTNSYPYPVPQPAVPVNNAGLNDMLSARLSHTTDESGN